MDHRLKTPFPTFFNFREIAFKVAELNAAKFSFLKLIQLKIYRYTIVFLIIIIYPSIQRNSNLIYMSGSQFPTS